MNTLSNNKSGLPEPGSLEQMLDDMPQNRCLYRDSGVWYIYAEDLHHCYYMQGTSETFHDFIKRAYEDDNVYKDAFGQ